MHEWVKEMALEVKQSDRQVESEQTKIKTTSNKLTKRLKARRNLKAEVAQLKDLRAECSNDTDQLEQNQPRAQEDKKTCVFGRQGGISSQPWPLHIMYYARV